MVARKILSAAGFGILLALVLTVVSFLLNLGINPVATSGQFSFNPAHAGAFLFAAVGLLAFVAPGIAFNQDVEQGREWRLPLAREPLLGLLVMGPTLGVILALTAVIWRQRNEPPSPAGTVWTEYGHDPLTLLLFAAATWATTNLGISAIAFFITHRHRQRAWVWAIPGMFAGFAFSAGAFVLLHNSTHIVALTALSLGCVPVSIILARRSHSFMQDSLERRRMDDPRAVAHEIVNAHKTARGHLPRGTLRPGENLIQVLSVTGATISEYLVLTSMRVMRLAADFNQDLTVQEQVDLENVAGAQLKHEESRLRIVIRLNSGPSIRLVSTDRDEAEQFITELNVTVKGR